MILLRLLFLRVLFNWKFLHPSMIMILETRLWYFRVFDDRILSLELLNIFNRIKEMILFNNNLPIFFVKILNRFVCVSSIKIFNRLFRNINFFNFIGPIISQRPITTSINLLLVLIDPFAHLLFKSSPYCIAQFLCKTIFDIDQNDEKEGSAAFSVNVLLLKIKDVLLGKSFVKNIF